MADDRDDPPQIRQPSAFFHKTYRQDAVNVCPSCRNSYWIVGRFTAECRFCGTALALAHTDTWGTGTDSHSRRSRDIVDTNED